MQYFRNFNGKFQYCSIPWTNSQDAFSRFLFTNKSVNLLILHIYPPFSGSISPSILPLSDSNHYAMPIMSEFAQLLVGIAVFAKFRSRFMEFIFTLFLSLKDTLGCKYSLLLLLNESQEGTESYCACTNYIGICL